MSIFLSNNPQSEPYNAGSYFWGCFLRLWGKDRTWFQAEYAVLQLIFLNVGALCLLRGLLLSATMAHPHTSSYFVPCTNLSSPCHRRSYSCHVVFHPYYCLLHFPMTFLSILILLTCGGVSLARGKVNGACTGSSPSRCFISIYWLVSF